MTAFIWPLKAWFHAGASLSPMLHMEGMGRDVEAINNMDARQ